MVSKYYFAYLKNHCVRVFQCEMQSDSAMFRVGVGAEKCPPGPTAGLHSVEPHGLSGVGG